MDCNGSSIHFSGLGPGWTMYGTPDRPPGRATSGLDEACWAQPQRKSKIPSMALVTGAGRRSRNLVSFEFGDLCGRLLRTVVVAGDLVQLERGLQVGERPCFVTEFLFDQTAFVKPVAVLRLALDVRAEIRLRRREVSRVAISEAAIVERDGIVRVPLDVRVPMTDRIGGLADVALRPGKVEEAVIALRIDVERALAVLERLAILFEVVVGVAAARVRIRSVRIVLDSSSEMIDRRLVIV